MDRKKAIRNIVLLGGGSVLAFAGFRGYKLFRLPALEKLTGYQSTIDELAEMIIPETDVPGARSAGVGVFVSKMIRTCTDRRSQNNFLYGLQDLAAYSRRHFSKLFQHCSAGEKKKIMDHFEKKEVPLNDLTGKIERKLLGEPFFSLLKKYTVLGYCTSQQGATLGLSYDRIPGKYTETQLSSGQKAWATQ